MNENEKKLGAGRLAETKSLLDEAKKVEAPVPFKKRHDPAEMLELALAFAGHRITSIQAVRALGWKHVTSAYTGLGSVLMRAARDGSITIKREK